jgi:hypothetical protein
VNVAGLILGPVLLHLDDVMRPWISFAKAMQLKATVNMDPRKPRFQKVRGKKHERPSSLLTT